MTRSTHLFIFKTGRGGGGAATGVAGASVLAGIASVAPLPLAPALPSSLAMPHTDAQTIVKRKRASSSRNHSDDSLVAKGKHNTFTWKCDKCPTIEIAGKLRVCTACGAAAGISRRRAYSSSRMRLHRA
eukprot:CAMPEP_0179838268 /NCGR_PEP_ID=MMETSP0982-20121206/583_1 /TAXON_ID=483367 /ORGANISM="non described non described, Strain CCMP 2436" /LENGTH=128 /DNA_ID=CAMNT_0021721623 /DNA_START=46 /DNA_END=428 /DNA_ORIENTATION=-